MTQSAHVLIVDDEPNVRKVLVALLEQAGHTATAVASAEEALDCVRDLDPDLVLTDLRMPGMDGLALQKRLSESFPEIPVVLLTAHGTVETAVEAMKNGAHDFLTKPFDKLRVLSVVAKSLSQAGRARSEFLGPLAPVHGGIIGSGAAIAALRRLIERVGPAQTTVLITGETGTGKELVAEAIHRASDRRDRPIVKVNCGALPESLVESELFGHERGAFTGADTARPGRFELADGGTIFLDEIGETPPAVQVKLLRVLQDGTVDRLGSQRPRRVDVRVIAATNRDLTRAVAAGEFREDLLYRLRVVAIEVPSLSGRREDIPQLVEFFLDKHARRLGRPRPRVEAAALASLASRPWPGNVRELENAVERAVLLGEPSSLRTEDFGLEQPAEETSGSDIKTASRSAAIAAEVRMIRDALDATGGNVTHAAQRLGLSRRGLQIKMKELGLRPAG